MQNPLLEAALGYAARGWPVLPLHSWIGRCTCGDGQCSSPAKHPRTGHGLQDASTDRAVLEEWWRRWPDSNVGVRCDRLFVLDLDGPGAAIALGEHGLDPDMHDCTTQTGVGRHLLFEAVDGARPRTRVLPDVDVRAGAGSYIVAPPSVHWTGALYEWRAEGTLPLVPATIRGLLGLTAPGEGGSSTVRDPGHEPGENGRTSGVGLALAEARDRGLLGVGEGRRHDTMLRVIGQWLSTSLFTFPELVAHGLAWAAMCTPPMPEAEALRIISDLWRREAAKHGGDPVFDYGDGEVAAPAAGTADIPWHTAAAWLADEPPTMRWLLRHPDRDGKPCGPREGDGMLARGTAGMLTAEGGAGKTAALIQLGMALLTGRPWFGYFHTPAPGGIERGRVCLLLAEEGLEDAWRRVHSTARALELDDDELEVVGKDLVILPLAGRALHLLRQVGAGSEAVETREFQDLREQLRREAGERGWSLIGIDPLARVAGVDAEGDNTMATRLVQAVETMASLPGTPSVLVLAHSSKYSRRIGEADSRGVTGLTDGSRWHATLTVKGAKVEFRQRKSNHSRPMPEPVLLQRQKGGLLTALPVVTEQAASVAGQLAAGMADVVQALREMGGRAASANSLAVNVAGKRSTVLGWIAEAAARGLIVALPGPRRSCGFVLPDSATGSQAP